jgi:hypothetical protein
LYGDCDGDVEDRSHCLRTKTTHDDDACDAYDDGVPAYMTAVGSIQVVAVVGMVAVLHMVVGCLGLVQPSLGVVGAEVVHTLVVVLEH